MTLSEQMVKLTDDVGEMKATVAAMDQKIDNIPMAIELAMLKHEQTCSNKDCFVKEDLLEQKLNDHDEKRFSKKMKTLKFIKEIVAFGIAVFVGKQL